MIPTAPVDICNMALDLMGESTTISSITDPSDEREELMSRWYDAIRQAVLREYVWNFAQKWVVLARSGDGEGIYEDAYALPNNFVRLNGVGENVYCPITAYEMGDRKIYASEGTSLTIRYNQDITTVQKFDPLFTLLLAHRLAAATAFQVTKKKSVVEKINNEIAPLERKAASVDGQEKKPVRVQSSYYLAARRRGGRSSGRYYDTEQ